MPFAPGDSLGPYRLLVPLGAGGMGQVWRARDTRLERDVAVKVLPEDFATDADRRRRFEQEARALAALNHPNIVAVYDVGENYFASELVEGRSLRGVHLKVSEALEMAAQIAEALAAAHAAGITHRDLKPDNIMVTRDHRVKVLDFGLAKRRSVTAGSDAETATTPGVILGTAGYMAPEQVCGEEADARADMFSFGVVLYELLSGRRAFGGATTVEALNAILKDDPAPLTGAVPAALERTLRRCLAKAPEQRWQSAADLASELRWIASGRGDSIAPRRPRRWFPWAAAVLGLAAGLAGVALYVTRGAIPTASYRFTIPPPENASFNNIALSADGRTVAFTATREGRRSLWVRSLDSLESRPLAGTEEAVYPFWSPDGQWIGFFSGGKLRKVAAGGGPVFTLADAPTARGGAWSNADGGVIIYAPNSENGLVRVAAAGGGAPTTLTVADPETLDGRHRWPQFLPDGRRFLYWAMSGQPGRTGIYLGSLDEPGQKKRGRILMETPACAMFVASGQSDRGHLLFPRDGSLLAQACNMARGQVEGQPLLVAERVGSSGSTYETDFAVSPRGVLVYSPGARTYTHLTWLDRGGKRIGTLGTPGSNYFPGISPDQKRVIFQRADGAQVDLWTFEGAREAPSRFTFHPAVDAIGIWTAKGDGVVFESFRSGQGDIYLKPSNGSQEERPLLQSEQTKRANGVSANGRWLIYEGMSEKTGRDLWLLPLDSAKPQPSQYLVTPFNEYHAQFSPDSQWVAYASDESGRPEIFVQSFPPGRGKWQISSQGGTMPRWRSDGRELFYYSTGGSVIAVPVTTGGAFQQGQSVPLFSTSLPRQTVGIDYDVAAGGQRFLVNALSEQAASEPYTVIVGWASAR